MEVLKRDSFLRVSTAGDKTDLGADEDAYELQALGKSFTNLQGIWSEVFQGSEPQCFDSTCSIREFARDILSPPQSHALDTTWEPKGGFKIVCIFTDDGASGAHARRVALERKMQYVSIDEILEECVQRSFDQQKQADQGASLSEREVSYVLLLYGSLSSCSSLCAIPE